MSTKLHVGNIPATMLEQDLRTMFGRFGNVEGVEIALDALTGRSKGYAIVAMAQASEAEGAVRGLNFSQCAGRTIGVSISRKSRS